MKFEKISEAEYRKFWEANKRPLESHAQMEERIKYFLDELPIPVRKTGNAAGYDFILPESFYIRAGEQILVPTGIKVKLDEDKYLGLNIRSSYGIKKGFMMANTVGIIDSDYYNNKDNEGHILICIWNRGNKDILIERGDACCQGIITKFYVTEDDEYGKGEKRVGGIGSTDTKKEDHKSNDGDMEADEDQSPQTPENVNVESDEQESEAPENVTPKNNHKGSHGKNKNHQQQAHDQVSPN